MFSGSSPSSTRWLSRASLQARQSGLARSVDSAKSRMAPQLTHLAWNLYPVVVFFLPIGEKSP